MAIPAAVVTACCSAMPTSKNRSGKRSWKGSSPVGPGMAAVMATTWGWRSASCSRASVKASLYSDPVREAVGVAPGTLKSWRHWTSSSSAGP